MESWLMLPRLEGQEEMADRFHFHMKSASISLQEHHLLIQRYDKLSNAPYRPIQIYLDHLRSAFNIGNILRTTEAFRLGTIVYSDKMPDSSHPKVIKTAMGAAPPFLHASIDACHRPLIALETAHGAHPIHTFSFPESFTLILGNEEEGIRPSLLEKVDAIIEIPLPGSKNSLNVASAFAIATAFIRSKDCKKSSCSL